MRLGKYHGLGNDFLVALAGDNPGLSPDPAVARALCDRRRGIGADGLLLGLDTADPDAPGAGDGGDGGSGGGGSGGESGLDARMVLLNSDGSPAEISGNGIRCLAHALLRAGAARGPELRIATPAGTRVLDVVDGDPGGELWIDVDMGPARPGPAVSPAAGAYPASHVATVDIGNPHLVLAVDDPRAVDLEVDGPALEAAYPEGINVHFVRVADPGRIELAVWERGAGVTEACGSGAAAAAVAASGWGGVSGPVRVDMPGGTARVEVVDGHAHLVGPSTFVGEVIVP